MNSPSESPQDAAQRFADLAHRKQSGLVREFVDFLRHNKKWWLAPIILMLLVIGTIVILGGTAAAPFIYPFM